MTKLQTGGLQSTLVEHQWWLGYKVFETELVSSMYHYGDVWVILTKNCLDILDKLEDEWAQYYLCNIFQRDRLRFSQNNVVLIMYIM